MIAKLDLPTNKARHFCPSNFDPSKWEDIDPVFQKLLNRNILSSKDLEQWIFDGNELLGILGEEEALKYIRNVCHTDNLEYGKSYMDYVENIKPRLKPLWNEMNQKFLDYYEKFPLPKDRYEKFYCSLKTQVSLFSKDNIPLQVETVRLCQEYQKICGSMSVEYKGEEKTIPALAPLLEEKDRTVRETVWKLIQEKRLQSKERLEEIFSELFALRVKIAKNASHPDYRSYCFSKMERFDYTPEDCLEFHHSIEKVVVPMMRKLQEQRKNQLKVDTLRPWDLAVDPLGDHPLKPFKDTRELIDGCKTIFSKIDPEFLARITEMDQLGLLDLDNRKSKAPGGFQHSLEDSKVPFIFMNSVGLHRDLETLLHEAGHAFNYYACKNDPLVTYRHPPMEFAEVASMSMELLSNCHFDVFYEKDDVIRAKKTALEDIVKFFPWCCTIDNFQHQMYTSPKHTSEDRKEIWLSILERFGGIEDWSGLEQFRSHMWHRQLHLFEVPFYYIEYGFAQMGALQVWLNSLKNPSKTLEQYKQALALGGSKSLKELYKTAGIKLVIKEKEVANIMEQVMEQMELLEKK